MSNYLFIKMNAGFFRIIGLFSNRSDYQSIVIRLFRTFPTSNLSLDSFEPFVELRDLRTNVASCFWPARICPRTFVLRANKRSPPNSYTKDRRRNLRRSLYLEFYRY